MSGLRFPCWKVHTLFYTGWANSSLHHLSSLHREGDAPMTTTKLILTVDDVASELRISTRSVRTLIKNGVLPTVRWTGLRRHLVSRKALEELIDRNELPEDTG